MYRVDYHLHSNHSMDSTMTLDQLCEAALAVGLQEICITDHTEFGHPDQASDIPPDPEAWLADLQHAREKYPSLKIKQGIEIGDNPLCRDRILAWHSSLPLDFRLLSLHLIDNEDPFFSSFFDDKEQASFYKRYVESKLESALAWRPEDYDAIAHLGYCAKFAPYPVDSRPLMWHHAPEHFEQLFRLLAQEGKPLEINTSGKKTMKEYIPTRDLLEKFHSFGGEFVTIGSDAHQPEYVGKWLDDARELAYDCGFRYLLTFDQRKPIPIPLL